MNGGRIHRYCHVREPPALNYSLPLPQGPSAMQLSCEPVLRRALLYPVNAQALQQRFPSSTRTHIKPYNALHTHYILMNMPTVGVLTYRFILNLNKMKEICQPCSIYCFIKTSKMLIYKRFFFFTSRGSHRTILT